VSKEFGSYVWPTRLFSADKSIVSHRAGHLREVEILKIVERIVEALRR
jgi:hypothetical protein